MRERLFHLADYTGDVFFFLFVYFVRESRKMSIFFSSDLSLRWFWQGFLRLSEWHSFGS